MQVQEEYLSRKCKAERDLHAYTRRKEARQRLEASNRDVATQALLSLASEDIQMLEGSTDSVLESTVMDVDTREAATMTNTDFDALEKDALVLGVKIRRLSTTFV